MTEIRLENVSSGYYGKQVLNGISLDIDDPGVYVVLGKNGAGKTTFFRTISGILKLYSGTVTIDGLVPYDDYRARLKCVYLSHKSGVPVTMKVSAIIDMFASMIDSTEEQKMDAIRRLELEDLMDRSFAALSQGQRKRVSIAKCLLRDREVYLFDEPTSNLDPLLASEVRETILDISRNSIVLYSSHNLYEARELGKNVIVINSGKIIYSGDIDSIPMGKYTIGIRADNVKEIFPEARLDGRFYILELESADEVPGVVSKLSAAGVRVREIREMSNPLENLLK